MNNRMTAQEYRKQFVNPALKEEREDEDFLKKVIQVDKKIKTTKPRKTEEDDLTKQVADYCEVLKLQGKVLVFSHIPSSTFTRSWSVKSRNKAMGVRPGVPDMLIVFPGKVLFLELKRLKGGVVSPFQKEWIKSLNTVENNNVAVVASGWDEAKQAIDDML